MKRKRRRKPNYRNILLVVLVVVLAAGTAGGLYIKKVNDQRTAVIEEVLAARKAYETEIENTSCPDNAPQEAFDQIKASALAYGKEAYDKLAEFEGKDIKSYYEMALSAQETYDDMENVYEQVMKNMPLYDEEAYFTFMCKENDTEDRLRFMAEFDQRDAMNNPPATLTEDLSEVPLLIQWDDRWGYVPYGDWYIGFAGCGPTAISMVASYLKQDPSITPAAVAARAMELDQYEMGAGTRWSFYSVMADDYQLTHSENYDPTAQDIVDSLQAGNLVILSMTPGDFTATGHFIVLTGLDENGQVKIHDPNSRENSEKVWDPARLASQCAGMWSFSR